MSTDGLKMQTQKRFTTATQKVMKSYYKTHLLLQKRKDDKYKKFYNFVFDLYVVWLLVF